MRKERLRQPGAYPLPLEVSTREGAQCLVSSEIVKVQGLAQREPELFFDHSERDQLIVGGLENAEAGPAGLVGFARPPARQVFVHADGGIGCQHVCHRHIQVLTLARLARGQNCRQNGKGSE